MIYVRHALRKNLKTQNFATFCRFWILHFTKTILIQRCYRNHKPYFEDACPCPTETELELVCCKEIQLQIPHIRDEWPASFKFWWKQTLPSCHQIDASVKVDGGQRFWVFLRETPLEIWQASLAPPCYIMTYSPLGSCRGQILWHNYFYWRRCGGWWCSGRLVQCCRQNTGCRQV